MQYAGGDNGQHFDFWEKTHPGKEIPSYSNKCSECATSIEDNYFIQNEHGSFAVACLSCAQKFITIDTFTEGKYKGHRFSEVLQTDPGYMQAISTIVSEDPVAKSAAKYLKDHPDEIKPHFTAGKYIGRTFESVATENSGYFYWLSKERKEDPTYSDALGWFHARTTTDAFTSGKYSGQFFEKVLKENPSYFEWLKKNGYMPFAVDWYDSHRIVKNESEKEENANPSPPVEPREGAITFGKYNGKTLDEVWMEDKTYLYFIVRKLDYNSSKRFFIESLCDFLMVKMGKGEGKFSSGKYKGKTYEEVYQENDAYYQWIRDGYTGKGEDFIRAWIWYLRK